MRGLVGMGGVQQSNRGQKSVAKHTRRCPSRARTAEEVTHRRTSRPIHIRLCELGFLRVRGGDTQKD